MVRVVLPLHLRRLAGVEGEVRVEVEGRVTLGAVLGEIEKMYPMLCGTMREHGTGKRRAMVRFFGCEEDLSDAGMEGELPGKVARGEEPLLVVGAIAGG